MAPTCLCSHWRSSRIAWRRSGSCSVGSACRPVSEMVTSWGILLARSCYLDRWSLWASGLLRWRLLRRCRAASLVSILWLWSRHPSAVRIWHAWIVVEIVGCWRLHLYASSLLAAASKSSPGGFRGSNQELQSQQVGVKIGQEWIARKVCPRVHNQNHRRQSSLANIFP